MTRILSLALAAALAAAAVQPATAVAPVNKAGVRKVMAPLLGFWAIDCGKAPGPDNPWETLVVAPDGYVMDDDYEGTDGGEAYVVAATRLDANHIRFSWEVTLGQPELELVYEIRGDRYRNWSSRAADGEFLVREGKSQTDEEAGQSRWYNRCPNRFPDDPVK